MIAFQLQLTFSDKQKCDLYSELNVGKYKTNLIYPFLSITQPTQTHKARAPDNGIRIVELIQQRLHFHTIIILCFFIPDGDKTV